MCAALRSQEVLRSFSGLAVPLSPTTSGTSSDPRERPVDGWETRSGRAAICARRRRLEAVLLHLVDQRAARQAEPAGGAGLVAGLGLEGGDDGGALDLGELAADVGAGGDRRGGAGRGVLRAPGGGGGGG